VPSFDGSPFEALKVHACARQVAEKNSGPGETDCGFMHVDRSIFVWVHLPSSCSSNAKAASGSLTARIRLLEITEKPTTPEAGMSIGWMLSSR
jgi:hypothetical protein